MKAILRNKKYGAPGSKDVPKYVVLGVITADIRTQVVTSSHCSDATIVFSVTYASVGSSDVECLKGRAIVPDL